MSSRFVLEKSHLLLVEQVAASIQAFAKTYTNRLVDGIAQGVSERDAKLHGELRAEIAELRSELKLLRGEMDGSIKTLRGQRHDDAA